MKTMALVSLIAIFGTSPIVSFAQSNDATETTEIVSDSRPDQIDEADLLTHAELENLVAPVALYPDTLLIQILVAATNPLQVVKGDRLLAEIVKRGAILGHRNGCVARL